MKISDKRLSVSQRENTLKATRFYFNSVSQSAFFPKLSRFINKYLYKFGFASSLNRYDNSLTVYSANADKALYSEYKKTDRFLNFGSGAFFHSRWSNYDYPGQSTYYRSVQGVEGKDFNAIDLCDTTLSVPEKEDSVSLIYCSHTLEHLDFSSSLRFLKECFRILEKGGVLRVALPNTKNDFYLLRCVLSQNSISSDIKENYIRDATKHVVAEAQQLSIAEIDDLLRISRIESNEFFNEATKRYGAFAEFDGSNPERHINYWDFDNLIEVVADIGFSCCIPSYQGSSVALPFTNTHVFDNTEPQIAFYADIVK